MPRSMFVPAGSLLPWDRALCSQGSGAAFPAASPGRQGSLCAAAPPHRFVPRRRPSGAGQDGGAQLSVAWCAPGAAAAAMSGRQGNKLPSNLPQLQNLIKRDPTSYTEEVRTGAGRRGRLGRARGYGRVF